MVISPFGRFCLFFCPLTGYPLRTKVAQHGTQQEDLETGRFEGVQDAQEQVGRQIIKVRSRQRTLSAEDDQGDVVEGSDGGVESSARRSNRQIIKVRSRQRTLAEARIEDHEEVTRRGWTV